VKKVFKRINKRISDSIKKEGGKPASFSTGKESLFKAEKKKSEVDLGFVGDITGVNQKAILSKIGKSYIPIASPIGQSQTAYYNINADTAAAELAAGLKASKIIFLTNVQGVLDQNKKLIKTLTNEEAQKLIDNETAQGGMIPKLKACMLALDKNVGRAHIIKAGGHALLEEILTKEGTGTMISR
jgi:acetylglutamate kinase